MQVAVAGTPPIRAPLRSLESGSVAQALYAFAPAQRIATGLYKVLVDAGATSRFDENTWAFNCMLGKNGSYTEF